MKFISSSVLIPINAGHFNSIGVEGKKKSARASIKKFKIGGNSLPFISAQALRKYIRQYIELITQQPNYYDRLNRKITKKDYFIVDPIEYFEDDFLGYSHPLYKNPNIDAKEQRLKIASMNRRSPFLTTGLVGVEKLTFIDKSEGWVHPKSGTPLPYKSEFSSGYFSGIFNLELDRIGQYSNYGDIIEMDPTIADFYKVKLNSKKSTGRNDYILNNQKNRMKQAIEIYFDCILNLFGGAKATMFGEKLHPNVIITTAMRSANSIPSNLFICNSQNRIDINYTLLEKFLHNWGHSISSPLVIGYRNGTFGYKEEQRLFEKNGLEYNGVEFLVTTPGDVRKNINGGNNEF
jgi:CRISPR-associated protein Cst2